MTLNDFGQHISQQFDRDIEDLRSKLLTMGGAVERQTTEAISALITLDVPKAERVIDGDHEINRMEVTLDEDCSRILALRQPAASDLRLIVAIIKTITDLERIGDQAEKIARSAIGLAGMTIPTIQYYEIRHLGDLVKNLLHNSLDAFARLDVPLAMSVAHLDKEIDREYEGLMRQMITFMMEDPRTIRRGLDIMWSARALERIGDHAKNICEYLIYMIEGRDVRHLSLEEREKEIFSLRDRGERPLPEPSDDESPEEDA